MLIYDTLKITRYCAYKSEVLWKEGFTRIQTPTLIVVLL
jgi:hypothetical protein